MPKVSVISPVYNVEKYLKRCLDCFANQTISDLEFILIDDCSSDNSLKILNEYAEKDSRFKIIALDKNSGAAIARNKGLDIAQGEYIGFIDPDDAIDLNYYEELYKKAKEEDYDIVKCPRKNISVDGKVQVSNIAESINEYGPCAFTHEWTCAIYKMSLIRNNNIRFVPEIIKSQDTVFLNAVVMHAQSIALIDNVFYYYHRRENSLNSKKISIKHIQSAITAKKTVLNNINSSDIYENNSKAYTHIYSLTLLSLIDKYYQTDSDEIREDCLKTLIEYYQKSKNKKDLNKKIKYKSIIKFLGKENLRKFKLYLDKYDDFDEFVTYNSFKPLEKIFSIKNLKNNYKLITLCAITFKIKKENK